MARFAAVLGGSTLALAVAMVATLAVPTLGASIWHYHAALATVLAVTAGLWRRLRVRRVATWTLASSGAAATLTGFAMLYTVDFPYKDWLTWWHCVASFAFVGAFAAHWANNNPRLLDLTARLFRPPLPGALGAAAWTIAAFGLAWTATPAGRGAFTRESYIVISSWTVLAGVVLAYGVWWLYRIPALRHRLEAAAHRSRARGLVDTGLLLANLGALASGFALLWLAGPLRDGPLKYASKWWHTATSVAFLAILALHLGFNARLLVAHARRIDRESVRRGTTPPGAAGSQRRGR